MKHFIIDAITLIAFIATCYGGMVIAYGYGAF